MATGMHKMVKRPSALVGLPAARHLQRKTHVQRWFLGSYQIVRGEVAVKAWVPVTRWHSVASKLHAEVIHTDVYTGNCVFHVFSVDGVAMFTVCSSRF